MARISGVDLPRDKRVEIGLTYIYGIGRKTASDILSATGVDPDIRVRDLTEDDVSKLREYIDHNVKVEGDLRRDRLLPRGSAPQGPACPWPEHQAKRPHPQGTQAHRGRQEKVRRERHHGSNQRQGQKDHP